MDLVEEFARLGKALKWKIYCSIDFSAWDPPTFRGFFGLIFPTKRIFEPTVLLLKKEARCHPFLSVVRCLFHNHLRLKRSSVLNVNLNCKFEFGLLTSHLFLYCSIWYEVDCYSFNRKVFWLRVWIR